MITACAAWPLQSGAAPSWFGVIACEARTDVEPVRPPFRLAIPELDLQAEEFHVVQHQKENARDTVEIAWTVRRRDNVLQVEGLAVRNNNDRWRYAFQAPRLTGDSVDIAGRMTDMAGKTLRTCTLNLTRLRSHLVQTWSGGSERAPLDWLLSNGQRWHYETGSAAVPRPLGERAPAPSEAAFVNKVRDFFEHSDSHALAVLDGDQIVFKDTKWPATRFVRFLSFSINKSITALAVGKCLCDGKLTLATTMASVIPELRGTYLGTATVRDLLTMSSGTWEGFPDTSIATVEEIQQVNEGRMSWLDVTRLARVNVPAKTAEGNHRTPGEHFAYKSTDPLTLGIVINRVSGQDYAHFVEQQILIPAGIAHRAIVGQDHFGYAAADGNLRLRLDDWIRLAIWIREQLDGHGCFADFVREAVTQQMPNVSQKIGPSYLGYGYFFWTGNRYAPDTFWALGHGGQAIGWNATNRRIMLVFSTSDEQLPRFYRLYDEWAKPTHP